MAEILVKVALNTINEIKSNPPGKRAIQWNIEIVSE
jgi:hypothetical protein